MSTRVQLYKANAEHCRHQAELPENLQQRDRWTNLAQQWTRLAEEAKRSCPKLRMLRTLRRGASKNTSLHYQ